MILLALLACVASPPTPPTVAAGPVRVRFTATVGTGTELRHHNGAAVLGGDGRARVALLGPLGRPRLGLVSDGVGVDLLAPGAQEVLRLPDADAVLDAVGLLGAAGLERLVLGEVRWPEECLVVDSLVAWTTDEGVRVIARRGADGWVDRLEALDPDGLAAVFTWTGRDAQGLPGAIRAEVPRLASTITLDALVWEPMPSPSAGLFAAPEGYRRVTAHSVTLEAIGTLLRHYSSEKSG